MLKIEHIKTKAAIAVPNVPQQNGYTRGHRYNVLQKPKKIETPPRYKNQDPAIRRRNQLVIPRKRVYPTTNPLARNELLQGTLTVPTSRGIISGVNAHKLNVGGELICKIPAW
jgi:small subunit ribosomal protein S8